MRASQDSSSAPLLALGALGVVFGDIGTSPLYAMRAVLGQTTTLDRTTVYGLTSTVIWSLILVVTALYVGLLLGRDDEGEGGLLALLAQVRRAASSSRTKSVATIVGIAGAALFLGDSVITPAISVLSASEGVGVANPSLAQFALPASVVILAGVFILQKRGSGRIGHWYGPIMLVWFLVVAGAGLTSIVTSPGALVAISPQWAVAYFVDSPGAAFLALGSVVLTVTGAEALYADLGHFGRRAITTSWLAVVFPCLTLGYVGEAAHVLGHPASATNPFYGVVPGFATIPVLVLATCATIIASEAVIAGAFTVLHQAGGLGIFPFLRTRHPSDESGGQIYVPAANWALGAAVLAVVLGFQSSTALASAYGLAVSFTILMTVCLFIFLCVLKSQRWRTIMGATLGLVVLAFALSTTPKVLSGGWLPVTLAALLFLVMWTWWRGRDRLEAVRHRDEGAIAELVEELESGPHRLRGSAVFLTDDTEFAPFAMRFLLDREGTLPEKVVVLSWHVDDKPVAPAHESSVHVQRVDRRDDVVRVDVTVGYRDPVDVRAFLEHAIEEDPECFEDFEAESASYFVSDPLPVVSPKGGLPRWQQRVFVSLDRLATDRIGQLALPRDRTVVMGREFPL